MDPHNHHDFRNGDDAAERKELQRLAPTLFGLPKTDPFLVPPHFFDQLPHSVQAKVVEQATTRRYPMLWRLAIAAPVVLVLLGAWWFLRERTSVEAPLATTETMPLEEQLEGLEEEDLFVALTEEDGTSALTLATELSDDELLSYLESEHPDLNELISEL